MPDSFLLINLLTNFFGTKQKFDLLVSEHRKAQDNKIASKSTENKPVLNITRNRSVVQIRHCTNFLILLFPCYSGLVTITHHCAYLIFDSGDKN